jgi:hypothetical protein
VNGEERDRLIQLETKMDERWNNHDKRSDENWEYIKDQLTDINFFIKNTPCKIHHEMLLGANSKINWLWGLLVALILSSLGMWIRLAVASL